LDYEHVKEIERPIGNGCTKPLLARLNNDIPVVIKLFNNVEGNKTLINELVCYKIAKLLKLPIPNAMPCFIDSNTIDGFNEIKPENYGVAFASMYLEKSTPLNPFVIRKLSNLDDFYKLLVFDHLIYNKDRNINNLILRFKKNDMSFYLIDHSHVFKNETIWDKYCFQTGIATFDVRDTEILNSNRDAYNMFYSHLSVSKEKLTECAKLFDETLSYDILSEVLKCIPPQWGMTLEDSIALLDYLDYRLNNLETVCNTIYENH